MKKIITCTEPASGSSIGGKFSKQSEMITAGIAVPEFFCLTIAFYEEVFDSIRSEVEAILDAIDFDDGKDIREAADSIQQVFHGVELSVAQKDEILFAFDGQFSSDVMVSVRASTVGHKIEESEDSVDNPFAGMSESFLYVKRDEICDKIKQCWGSGFSQESLIYRQVQGMNLLGFGVAVGVQKMVFGERSFVLFTADPKTAAKDQVIVAGYGIGEGVVQERVPVDHYFVAGKTSEITQDIADKDCMLTLDKDAGSGLCELPVEENLWRQACLTDAEIKQLVDIGIQIESLFGCPQDIEGTFTAEGSLHILQSRPIALDYSRQLIWTNTNVTESFPGISSPLTYTFAKYFYRVIFYDSYRRLGVSPRMINDNFEPLDKMIGYLDGRVYYCLSHFYLLHKQSPLYPLFGTHWENMIGLTSSFQSHQESSDLFAMWGKVKKWARVGSNLVETFYHYLNHDRYMFHYHKWWEDLISPMRGKSFEGDDPLTLVKLFHKVWGEVGNNWGLTLTTDGYLIPMYGLLETLFKKWGLDDDPGLLSDLLCGNDETLLSVEIILSSVNIAEFARGNSELKQKFKDLSEHELWEEVKAKKVNAEFTEMVEKHLHYYGDRGLQELKLEQPMLRDTPWVLIKMVKQYVFADVTVESIRNHEQGVRDKAEVELARLLAGKTQKQRILNVLLPRLRRLIRHRENSRYCRSELYGFSKNIFKGLARYFVQRDILNEMTDIYYLTQDEVFGYIDGTGVTENLQVIADLRRKEHAENLTKDVATNVTTLGAIRENVLAPVETGPITYDEDVLQGLGSSAGKVTGIAKVVDDPNDAGDITEDMILIARETDPGWLFLMLASKGMVVERGSMLSHTAITGRKFGIPTIVALPGATTRIPDGARIEMDGSSGIVVLVEEQSTSSVEDNNVQQTQDNKESLSD
ncbi:hypothetical protein A9Q99_10985 [Gammaproteobacteria bacterium 45_16_T64]|nr:hypothetical protein A9Q99_10985 [Gammaproteobacteria bacterium 45_16_T64]